MNPKNFQGVLHFINRLPERFGERRYFRVASALAFTTLLALVPLLTVVFSTLSLFPVFESWSGSIEGFIYKNFVPQLGDQIQTYLHDFSSKAGQLTVWGLIFLLVSTLTLLATIEDVFNDIWNVDSGRPWGQRLLVYWAMLTLGPILIAVSLSISSYFLSMAAFSDASVLAGLRTTLFRALPFILELAAFVLFFSMVPNCDVKIRHALAGGLVATIMFELAKYGFGLYLLHFNSYQLIYGAVAVLPIFLVWVYLSWLVVLIGATVAAALGDLKAQQNRKSNPPTN